MHKIGLDIAILLLIKIHSCNKDIKQKLCNYFVLSPREALRMKQVTFSNIRIKSFRASITCLLSLICLACANQPLNQETPKDVVPYANGTLFGERPIIAKEQSIYRLSDQQRLKFLSFFHEEHRQWQKPNKRIYEYLQQYVKNYNFFNKTLTASQSLAQSQGNCLSLAILTTALANSVGVDTGYQLVESAPVYQKEGNIILSSQHVRSLLFEPKQQLKEGKISLGPSGLVIDYFPAADSHIRRRVPKTEFIAMFYRNKAADAIIHKDYNLAYWLLRDTLIYVPFDQHTINMMAVVHQNIGLKSDAENLYQFGIRYASNKLDLLRNYRIFLKQENRFDDAKKIDSQLSTMKTINPFDWILLGHTAFEQHKYSEARRYYKRAVKIAPYLHQAYMGVAKSEFKLGNLEQARASLNLAQEKAFDNKTKSLYQAKLVALSNRNLSNNY